MGGGCVLWRRGGVPAHTRQAAQHVGTEAEGLGEEVQGPGLAHLRATGRAAGGPPLDPTPTSPILPPPPPPRTVSLNPDPLISGFGAEVLLSGKNVGKTGKKGQALDIPVW